MPRRNDRYVNMSDLAREAGVSIASVSRALNDAPGVSESTRQRIKDTAARMAYTVSPDASRLKRGASNRIAVVVRDIDYWFYSSMLQGVLTAVRQADLDVLLFQVQTDDERRRFFDEMPVRRLVDGVIVLAFPITEHERTSLDRTGADLVIAGGRIGDCPHVRIDDARAARQAVNHLINAGHERIGMINVKGTWHTSYEPPIERARGFTEAMEAAGLSVPPELVVDMPYGRHGGADGMGRLLSQERPPTAVLAFSDEVAIGAMLTLRRASIPVPSGMSIIGVDDHPMSELSDLTTVHQPAREQGEAAGRLLLDLVEQRNVEQCHLTLPTHLVVRGSTGPPR